MRCVAGEPSAAVHWVDFPFREAATRVVIQSPYSPLAASITAQRSYRGHTEATQRSHKGDVKVTEISEFKYGL